MDAKRAVQNCRWAEPTMFQQAPVWLDAWNMPWVCRRDAAPHLIAATDQCALCPRWEERPKEPIAWDFAAFSH